MASTVEAKEASPLEAVDYQQEVGAESPNEFVVQPGTGGMVDAIAPRPRVIIPTSTYQQLVKNSAIGRAYAGREESQRAPDQFTWHDEAYAVVYAANLAPFAALSRSYASEAEATAELQGQLLLNPQLAGELIVVPAYQLAL